MLMAWSRAAGFRPFHRFRDEYPCRHGFRRNRLSRPPRRSTSPRARVFRSDRLTASGPQSQTLRFRRFVSSVGRGRHSRRAEGYRRAGRHPRGGQCGQPLRRTRTRDFSFRTCRGGGAGGGSGAPGRSRTARPRLGLGADAASPSLYIRKRGEGELAVKAAFTDVILLRPAVMFGPDDAFLTTMLALLRRLPIYPMFGRG